MLNRFFVCFFSSLRFLSGGSRFSSGFLGGFVFFRSLCFLSRSRFFVFLNVMLSRCSVSCSCRCSSGGGSFSSEGGRRETHSSGNNQS